MGCVVNCLLFIGCGDVCALSVPIRAMRTSDNVAAGLRNGRAGSPRSMKVIFVNRFFFPDESATAQILTDLAKHLRRNGFDVRVITSRAQLRGSSDLDRRETVLNGIEVRRVRQWRGTGRSLGRKLIQLASFYPLALVELLRMVSPGDVVVAKTDPPLVSTIAWIATKVRRAQLVNWLQDVYPEVAANLGTPILRGVVGNWLKALRNFSLRSAVANVAIGQLMARTLAAEGVPRSKIRVIPNWVDEQALRSIRTNESCARKKWGLHCNDFVLAYSGNLGRAHESETLLAAARLIAKRQNIKFLFIGGGHGYDELRSTVEKYCLPNFIFKPHQPQDELQDTLGAGDAHWLSLRCEMEGLIVPSKLYGILAAGRPLVAVTSPEGEVAGIVRDNSCGFVVEPGNAQALADAIVALAEDPALRLRMGVRARHASEALFPRMSSLRSWTDLIASLCEDQQSGSDAAHPFS